MKLFGLFVLISFLHFSLWGQSQTITFSGKEIPLKNVFRIIKCQTGILFFYDEALVKDAKPVTIQWKNITLEAALNEIFKDQPLTWILEGKTVTVIKKNPPAISVRNVSQHFYSINTRMKGVK